MSVSRNVFIVSLTLLLLFIRIEAVLPEEMIDKTDKLEEMIDKTDMPEEISISIDKISDNFSYSLKFVGYDAFIEPSESTLNPHNDFLQIPGNYATGELRADFSLDFEKFFMGIKPRANLVWQRWEEGKLENQEKTADDFFIYEWLIRGYLTDNFIVSYGRQNLQWGPAYLMSPSNPFFRNNGQSNPKTEVPGSDFARALWVINSSCSVSAMVNTAEGGNSLSYGIDAANNLQSNIPEAPETDRRYNIDYRSIRNELIDRLGLDNEFYPSSALKIDFTGFKKYFSLIGSYKEKERLIVGAFGGMTLSDAMLFYAEGSFSLGTDVLYPVPYKASPFGSVMMKSLDDSSEVEDLILIGTTYTLETGQTFVLEGVYNSAGYNHEEAERYFYLRKRAYDLYDRPYYLGDLSKLVLYQSLNTKLRLLRKHYIMAQFYQTQIYDVLNLVFRYTYNIDDNSSQFVPIFEYDIFSNSQLFLIGQYSFGAKDTEYRSLVDNSLMAGFEITF
jgi:hypothetical protein